MMGAVFVFHVLNQHQLRLNDFMKDQIEQKQCPKCQVQVTPVSQLGGVLKCPHCGEVLFHPTSVKRAANDGGALPPGFGSARSSSGPCGVGW